MPGNNTSAVLVQVFQNGWTIVQLQWLSTAGSLCNQEEAAKKNNWNYYWIGAQQNIGMFNKLWNYCISFIHLSLFEDKLGLCSINRLPVLPDKNTRFDWLISGPSNAVLGRQKGLLDQEIEDLFQ